MLACGHPCCGFAGEQRCLPCLDEGCVMKNEAATLSVNADSYCSICYTDGLGQAPSVMLECRHIYHLECMMNKVKGSWNGARITFSFMDCPACKAEIKARYCPELENELEKPR